MPDQVEYQADNPDDAQGPRGWDEIDSRLGGEQNFWLVALRRDGRPHAVSIWGIWDGSGLWYTMSPRTWTARYLSHDPRALAHLPDARDVVIIEGSVDRPEPLSVPPDIVDRYESTFGWRLEPTDDQMPYFILRASVVRSWASADLTGSASTWDFVSG